MMKILSDNEKKTFEVGFELSKILKGGEIILLDGELGAGKTVFTKGIAAGLNISQQITSPTFTIMNEYAGMRSNSGISKLAGMSGNSGISKLSGKRSNSGISELSGLKGDSYPINLYHFDAYRLKNGKEAEEAGLCEYFGATDGVCVIEWYTNIEDVLARFKAIKVQIKYIDENKREITIND